MYASAKRSFLSDAYLVTILERARGGNDGIASLLETQGQHGNIFQKEKHALFMNLLPVFCLFR